jgi:phage terminase large subunit GpA-like protein
MTTAVASIRQARAAGIRPDPVLTVSAWADRYRRLPKKSSAEPGAWRTARTPYLREIMDCLSTSSPVEEVVFMKAAQVGGTEVILNFLGYIVDHSPGPVILVQPTVELGKRFSRQRVEPLMSSTPQLAEKVLPARMRDSGNTLLGKDFAGGQLIITGANSAVGLRSMPAQYALLDEIDGYPVDVDEEGSPVDLVEARQRTFARRKRIKVSTPTIAGRSAIEEAYVASDQRRYYVPCPDCGEMQPLEFHRLTWSKLGLPPEQAVYECRACFHQIPHHLKTWLLEHGEWRAENPLSDPRVRGYRLSSLYAPLGWISWGDIALKFARVHKAPEKHRVFINTVLGDVWTAKGEAPEWRPVYDRRETYRVGTAPMGVRFLTAACDVQRDRLIVEVVGWGRGKTSWSVTTELYPGDTTDLEKGPWLELAKLLDRTFPHESGHELPVRILAVDSGDNTQTVYAWTRNYPQNRVIAVKGFNHGLLIGSPTPVEVTLGGKKFKRGARMWPVNVDLAKSEFYGWLRLEAPTDGSEPPHGFCHFPQYGEEYFRQLTAEHLVAHKTRKGYVRLEWELIPGRANHALDVRVYARAAAALIGLDRLRERDWEELERSLGITGQSPAAAGSTDMPPASSPLPPPKAPEPTVLPAIRRGQWLTGRRPGWLKGGR